MAFFALLTNHLIRTPCALLFFFLAGFLAVADGQVTSPEIEKLIQLGRAEADKGDFAKALGYFNKAMGYLKQASPRHPLNEVVRKEIRIAKGRSLIARYQNRSGLKIIKRDELLPLGEEPDEILVSQRFGTILARQVWQSKEIQEIGEFIGLMKLNQQGCEKIKKIFFELKDTHKGKFHDAESFRNCKIIDILQEIIDRGLKIEAETVNGKWCEIDTIQDLEIAKKIFTN